MAASRRFLAGWGRLTETMTGGRDAICLRPDSPGFRDVAGSLQLPFLDELRRRGPDVQRFLAERGWHVLRSPDWSCAACVPAPSWLLRLEIVFLDLGLLLSLYTAIASPNRRSASHAAGRSRPSRPGHSDRAVVRPGNLDCVSTNADAWNDADDEVTRCRQSRRHDAGDSLARAGSLFARCLVTVAH